MNKIKSSIAIVLSAALMASAVPGRIPVASAADTAGSVSKPTVNSKHTVTWDCVYFGKYWQEDTNGDGKVTEEDERTPIKWRVLTVEGEDNPVTYAKGDRAVQDKVFLLSYSEATKAEYDFDTAIDTKSKTRCAEKTGYDLTQAGGINTDKWWWLRTQGSDRKHMIVIRGKKAMLSLTARKV